jgi:polyphosphate kinase 2 (PPK2 family)
MLETLDLKKSVDKTAYKRVFPALQERLRALQYELQRAEIATVVVFEGVDGAGKGTTISRLVGRLDPRLYRVVPSTPPTKEERGRHFLWRYQMKLPGDGSLTIFDRSWYGRVLVERIDGGLDDDLVRRAYTEIRDYERWLADDGQVVVKFWLHISKKMQRKRLKALAADSLTAWKVSPEDWKHHRQYEKWNRAAEQMFTATDTPCAPWTLVAAGDKRACRVDVYRTLIQRMEEALSRRLSDPKAVSRTTLAKAELKEARDKASAALSTRARAEAAAAGLPLEEGPDPLKKPRAAAKAARAKGKGKAKGAAKPAKPRRKGRAFAAVGGRK